MPAKKKTPKGQWEQEARRRVAAPPTKLQQQTRRAMRQDQNMTPYLHYKPITDGPNPNRFRSKAGKPFNNPNARQQQFGYQPNPPPRGRHLRGQHF